jgi:hypothetical protein
LYPNPEKGEAGASILGSFRVYVVTELKEPGNSVMFSASNEEMKGTQ